MPDSSPLSFLGNLIRHVGSGIQGVWSQALEGLANIGRLALSALLRTFGFTLQEVDDFFNKVTAFVANAADNAVRIAQKVLTNAGQLFDTLRDGVSGGFSRFFGNLGQHLLQGALDWAFGGVQVNLTIPSPLNAENIAYFFLRLVGATWDQIKTRVLGKLGINQQTLDAAIQGVDWLADLLDEGPQQALFGLLERAFEAIGNLAFDISNNLTELKDRIIGALTRSLIQNVLPGLIASLIPGAGILKKLYDLILWVVNNAARIVQIIQKVVQTLEGLLAGNVEQVAEKIKEALVDSLPAVLDLVARAAGVNVAGTVRGALRTITEWVGLKIDAIATWLAGFLPVALLGGGAPRGFIQAAGPGGVVRVRLAEMPAGMPARRVLLVQVGNGQWQAWAAFAAAQNPAVPMNLQQQANGLIGAAAGVAGVQAQLGNLANAISSLVPNQPCSYRTVPCDGLEARERPKARWAWTNVPIIQGGSNWPPFDWKRVQWLTAIPEFGVRGSEARDSTQFLRFIGGANADDAGHVLGRQWGGSGQLMDGNVFPHKVQSNRGEMNRRDNEVKRLLNDGKCVCIRITLIYTPSNLHRPSRLLYEVWVNEQKSTNPLFTQPFDNPI